MQFFTANGMFVTIIQWTCLLTHLFHSPAWSWCGAYSIKRYPAMMVSSCISFTKRPWYFRRLTLCVGTAWCRTRGAFSLTRLCVSMEEIFDFLFVVAAVFVRQRGTAKLSGLRGIEGASPNFNVISRLCLIIKGSCADNFVAVCHSDTCRCFY